MGAGGLWPWLTFAALGAYHGINPGMGWLFAVALGLQDKSRRSVLQALPPIALGHAASIAGVAILMGAAQVMLPHSVVRALAAAVVLAYAIRRLLRTRHPRWVGMRVGPRDLAAWSFVMSSAHGAGLMLVPVLLQCTVGSGHPGEPLHGRLALAALIPQVTHIADPGFLVAAVGVHTFSLLAVSGVVAVIVYEKMGLALLRRAWVNLDLVWSLALLGAGITTLIL